MKDSVSQSDALGEKVQYGIRTVLPSYVFRSYLKIFCHSGKEKKLKIVLLLFEILTFSNTV